MLVGYLVWIVTILPFIIGQTLPAGHSPKLGYAFDGFPVYGPYTDGGVVPTDLDICNGRTHPTLGYLYHTTQAAPYTFGCYAGQVLCSNFMMMNRPECVNTAPSSGSVSLTCSELGLISGVKIQEVPWTIVSGNIPTRARCTVTDCPSTAAYCWDTNNTMDTAYTSMISCTEQSNELVIQANGVPNHFIGKFPMSTSTYHLNRPADNPNSLSEQSYTWRIPKYPTMKSIFPTSSIVTNVDALPFGPTGFAINSVPFFNMYNSGMLDAVNGDEGFEVLDMCLGHAQMQGGYHYHTIPYCLINEINGATNNVVCGNGGLTGTTMPTATAPNLVHHFTVIAVLLFITVSI